MPCGTSLEPRAGALRSPERSRRTGQLIYDDPAVGLMPTAQEDRESLVDSDKVSQRKRSNNCCAPGGVMASGDATTAT